MTATTKVRARKEQHLRRQEVERKAHEAAKGKIDLPFLILALMLTVIGLIMVFSASFPSAYYETGDAAHYLKRQAVFAVVGIVAMIVVSSVNYQRWRGAAKLLLGVSVFLLILVLIPHIGINRNNAQRWLGFGETLTFQPSEIAKLAVIVFFADSISKKKRKMESFREGVLPYMLILGLIAVLMLLEPHLSGTILIVGVGVIMMIVGGIRAWLVGVGVGGIGLIGILYVKLVESGVISYGAGRILMWKDPWIDATGDGFQLCQGLIAIGSGGLLGVGLGKSRQKFLYLPEEHNDYIFAIVCEELGLIGAIVIMGLFMALILRGFWIALHARDRFGTLLVVGIISLIAMQTFLNIAVVTGFVPTTGISLPFFSYGGTALALQLFEIGIVLSVSRQMPAVKAG